MAETKPFEPEPANTGVGMCNKCKMVVLSGDRKVFYEKREAENKETRSWKTEARIYKF